MVVRSAHLQKRIWWYCTEHGYSISHGKKENKNENYSI